MKYEIGSKIRHFRELRGLSQKDLAQRIGVTNSRISNWEQGLNRPDVDNLLLLCESLEVSADKLLGLPASLENLNEEERELVLRYRQHPDLKPAIRILLGIEANEITTP